MRIGRRVDLGSSKVPGRGRRRRRIGIDLQGDESSIGGLDDEIDFLSAARLAQVKQTGGLVADGEFGQLSKLSLSARTWNKPPGATTCARWVSGEHTTNKKST